LELDAELSDVSIAGATAYLPSRVMKPKLTVWLRNALLGGRITDGKVTFSGALADFPFDDGQGRFQADATFQGLVMAYANGWPQAEQADGSITFANASLLGKVSSGRILNTGVSDVTVTIPEMRKSVLSINGSSSGSFGDLIRYLNESPIGEKVGPTLAKVEAGGEAAGDISLVLPIGRLNERTVNVDLTLSDAFVGLKGLRQQLTEVDGFVQYSNAGITGEGIVGKLLGSTVTLDVAPEDSVAPEPAAMFGNVATVVTVRGSLDAIDLSREFPGSLARVLDGVTDYTARARFPVRRPGRPDFFRVDVDSALTGMAIGLPAPLEKRGNASWQVRASAGFPANDRLELRIERDTSDIAQLAFRHDGEGWRLHRGAAAFGGASVTLPEGRGIVLGGSVPFIDLSGWLNLGDGSESGVRAEDYLLAADLKTESLRAFGQQFTEATLALDRSEREWLVQVEADRIEGAIFVPFDTPSSDPVTARLNRLWLLSESDRTSQQPDPRSLPALTLSIGDFRYDQMQFGSLEATTRRSEDGIVIDSLLTRADSFRTEGTGAWTMGEEGHRSQVELLFTSTNMLDTLARLDYEPTIDSEDAQVQFALNWPGPPGRNFLEQINGEVNVSVGAGQLQNVEPGAGRVFGLMSITELPRRLSLDFRDVFDSGFGFNAIRGDFTLNEGNAYTSNLVLDGPAAQVGIVGRAGIAARDYDQTAVVHASLGATLPIAGALAGGPAVGAALLIFSEVFKKPLQDMVRINYRITGSWDDPQVQRVLDSQLAAEVDASEVPTPPAEDTLPPGE
ncbi:MAG: AsmA-like C-terminal region-containing protein, partial [Pseudomonadota bacterium]